MIHTFRKLNRDKDTPQGHVNLTMFYVNLFLLMCHIFLMVIYVLADRPFMIYANTMSLLIYISYTFACYKNINRYVSVAFIEIWSHMMLAILSFGWKPCFQNWSFAVVAAYFLPSFSDDKKYSTKKAFIFSFITIFTYFFVGITLNIINYKITAPMPDTLVRILYLANNAFSFFSIIMFALFYMKTNQRKQNELTRKADYDELTGLYNRYALNQVEERMTKDGKNKYSLAIIDIDHFKNVNDTYGHKSGDMVLTRLARIMESFSNNDITVGRWGGEEFVIMANERITYADFLSLLEKLRVKVSKTKFAIEKKQKIDLTISLGAAQIENKNLEKAIPYADKNLYEAKETGRNKLIG